MRSFFTISCLIVSISFNVYFVDEAWSVGGKKQDKIRSSRWTLTDWLITKKKMALMDQWLAMNSSTNIFEGFIYGSQGEFAKEEEVLDADNNPLGEFTAYRGGAGFFVAAIGLEYMRENTRGKDYNNWSGKLMLRILGTTDQGLNLTAHYGFRSTEDVYTYDNYFVGGSLKIYFASFLGAKGNYDYYLNRSSREISISLRGNRVEGTVFLDLGGVVPYVTWFTETLNYAGHDGNSTNQTVIRRGSYVGLKLYF